MKPRAILTIIMTLAAVCGASSQIIPATGGNSPLDKAKEVAFSDNERLTYVVSYRAALVPNIEAGEVVMRTDRTTVDGVPAYRINAQGKVFASFKKIFDLEDTYQSWLSAEDLRPLKFSFRLREGKFRANCDYAYDWVAKKVTTYYHNLKRTQGRERVIDLTDRSYDVIGLFYNLRCVDMGQFTVGARNTLQMVLDDKIKSVNFVFLGREERRVGRLGTFRTLKFSCTIATSTEGESFDDGSEFFLWVTDDKNRIPVYLESPVKVGSVRVTLSNYQNLKHTVSKVN